MCIARVHLPFRVLTFTDKILFCWKPYLRRAHGCHVVLVQYNAIPRQGFQNRGVHFCRVIPTDIVVTCSTHNGRIKLWRGGDDGGIGGDHPNDDEDDDNDDDDDEPQLVAQAVYY